MAAVRTVKPRMIKRPGLHEDPSWADVQDYFSGPIPPVVSLHREINRKRQDAVDFSLLVTHNKEAIKRDRLRDFGELVYSRGGTEFVKLVDDIVEGRQIVI